MKEMGDVKGFRRIYRAGLLNGMLRGAGHLLVVVGASTSPVNTVHLSKFAPFFCGTHMNASDSWK